MTASDGELQPEEIAIRWPEAEYRAWVQSQIASQMLRRLGGITLFTVLAVGASLWTAYQSAREQLIIDAANSAAEQLETDLRVEVAGAIINQADLLKEAEKVFIENALPQIVLKPEFIAPINAAISDGGGPQRIILEEARKRMEDLDGSLSMRLLGLQLYALFYPTVQELGGESIPPLRETLYRLLDSENGERQPDLLAAVMDRYPMGEGFSVTHPDADCDTTVQTCREWDRLMIQAVLNFVETEKEQFGALSPQAIHNFFIRTPAELASTVLAWTQAQAEFGAASSIEVALLSGQDPRTVRMAVAQFSNPSPSAPDIVSKPNLRALGQLPFNAPLERIDRRAALRQVWNAISSENKRLFFSAEALEKSLNQPQVLPPLSLTEDNRYLPTIRERIPSLTNSAALRAFLNRREDPPPAELQAVVALLRTDAESIGGGPDVEWRAMFEEAVQEGHRTEALVAVGLRLIADSSSGLNVENVAVWLLSQAESGKGASMDSLRAIALRHVPDEQLVSWASRYKQFWDEEKPSRESKTSVALFERLAVVREDFDWLEELFALAAPERNFEDHLLHTVAYQYRDTDSSDEELLTLAAPEPSYENNLVLTVTDQYRGTDTFDDTTALTRALRNVLRSKDAPEGIYKVLEARVVSLSASDRKAANDTLERLAPELVANAERVTSLSAIVPWIGQNLSGNVQRLHLQSNTAVEIDDFEGSEKSEIWYTLTTDQMMPLKLTGAINGTVSVFDAAREIRLAHYESNERNSELQIETISFEAEYAIRVRTDGPYIRPLRIEPGKIFVPTTRENAIRVSNSSQPFHSSPNGGELWLLVEGKAGQTITAETSAFENPNSNHDSLFLDTVIELYSLEDNNIITYDDDGGGAGFSKLIYRFDVDGPKLLRIRPFNGVGFTPNTQFFVTIKTND